MRSIIALDPVTFTYGGTDYAGTLSGTNLRRPLELGGFQDEPELTLVIARSDANGSPTIDPLPSIGEKVTVNGLSYRIERTESDAEGAGYQMDLRSANE